MKWGHTGSFKVQPVQFNPVIIFRPAQRSDTSSRETTSAHVWKGLKQASLNPHSTSNNSHLVNRLKGQKTPNLHPVLFTHFTTLTIHNTTGLDIPLIGHHFRGLSPTTTALSIYFQCLLLGPIVNFN